MSKKNKKLIYKVNFLKSDQTSLAASLVNWISVLGLPIMLVVSAIVIGSSFYKLYLDQLLADIQQEVSMAANTTKSLQGLENQLNALTSKFKDIHAWKDEKIIILLPRLSLVIPPEITLNELAVDGNSVRFSGKALDKQAVADLVNNITNIKNVDFPDNEIVDFYDARVEEISTTSLTTSSFNFAVRFSYKITEKNDK